MNNLPIIDKVTFSTQAAAFFEILFSEAINRSLGQIELRVFPKGSVPGRLFCSSIKEAVSGSLQYCESGIDAYFGVNPRTGGGGKKENVHYLTAFHAEVDYGSDGHRKSPKYSDYDQALTAIQSFQPKPTFVNHSGGGFHCYWVLESPVKVEDAGIEKLESVNRSLISELGGDGGTQDISRVLRVPGTFNFKIPDNPREVTVVWMDGPKYKLEDFSKFMTKAKILEKDMNLKPPASLDYIQISDKIKNLIVNGNDGTYPSRSEADMAVIAALVSKGFKFEQIKKIFESHAIGEKYRGHNSPDHYLKHNFEKAKSLTGLTDEELSNPLFVSGAITKSEKGKYSLDTVTFQEFITRKYRLIYQEEDGSYYQYNGACYEVAKVSTINSICQSELKSFRKLFPPSTLKDFLHYCIGDERIPPEKATKDRMRYLTLQNGLFDLEEQALTPHSREIFTTNLLPYKYDPEASCPRFLQYLEEVFMGDTQRIDFIQEAVGYAFHKSIPKPAVFFLIGNGSNGKSVFINMLSELVGKQNTCTISLNSLDREYYTMDLIDKMINISSETPRRKTINTDTVKAAVSGDYVVGRGPYKLPVKFRPFAKHYLAMNEVPVLEDDSHGMRRRLYLIEFPKTFSEEEMDVCLPEKIYSELSGIFNWALQGYRRLKAKEFVFVKSKAMSDSKKKYREQTNSVSAFLASGNVQRTTPQNSERFKAVYEAYERFCKSEGFEDYKHKPEFRALLEREGFKVANSSKDGHQVHVYGIKI